MSSRLFVGNLSFDTKASDRDDAEFSESGKGRTGSVRSVAQSDDTAERSETACPQGDRRPAKVIPASQNDLILVPFASDLENFLSEAGKVREAFVIKGREIGRSRDLGFVTRSTPKEAEVAANIFKGKRLPGHTRKVNEAEDRDAMGSRSPLR
jgi:RNA recognition motif-containing protein